MKALPLILLLAVAGCSSSKTTSVYIKSADSEGNADLTVAAPGIAPLHVKTTPLPPSPPGAKAAPARAVRLMSAAPRPVVVAEAAGEALPVPLVLTNTAFGQALVLTVTNATQAASYSIDTSVDLTEWQALVQFDDSDPYVVIHDYAYGSRPYFFYRLKPL